MQPLCCLLLLTLLSGCAFLPGTDGRSARIIENHVAAGNIWAASEYYNNLEEQQKQGTAVSIAKEKLNARVADIRKKTIDSAAIAINKSDWKEAINLYREQMLLIKMDDDFHSSYQKFLEKKQHATNTLRDSFIVTRAEYLIKAIPVMISDQQLNPYNIRKEKHLNDIKQESKEVANRLLELGVNAMKKNDIATARTLIPLAQQLDDNKATVQASKMLSALTKSFDDHIEKLVDEGTQFYSKEQYGAALEKWNQVLYLDPENDKVQDHKARTQKVLRSLEELKKQQHTQ